MPPKTSGRRRRSPVRLRRTSPNLTRKEEAQEEGELRHLHLQGAQAGPSGHRRRSVSPRYNKRSTITSGGADLCPSAAARRVGKHAVSEAIFVNFPPGQRWLPNGVNEAICSSPGAGLSPSRNGKPRTDLIPPAGGAPSRHQVSPAHPTSYIPFSVLRLLGL
ncbi:hypothetical protein EVAR_85391_1 [Eumeta japonica]|uniref:Uncharacterized protein n=1 Tax=Eumeta variegata TaxID=151549 RepID=A0A4C1SJY2_EUMVA|nr:hypothetical protein EVAR_85391_1 [Eumeta japonica]